MFGQINDANNMILNECLEALGLIIEYDLDDNPTHQHSIRVGEGCAIIAEKMGLQPKTIQQIYFAGLIHDIGKVAVDLNILRKKEKLLPFEFELIKQHSIMGGNIIASLPELSNLAFWIRWHHEKWDGTGYPDGLYRDEIPVEVQILSAVDCFDSLQTPRLDRPSYSAEKSYEIVKNERGISFNPVIVDLIFDMMNKKELIRGKTSDKFIDLKKKYLNIPLNADMPGYWEGIGMAGLYPILRLFAKVIDAKHGYTHGHSTRVSILSKYLAEKAGFSTEDIIKVEVAGLLHDAGKISIPHNILDKKNIPDPDEWELIKAHPVRSFEILSGISAINEVADITLQHHERLDGSGYPGGLKGDEISTLSQIIAISDTFDAITSERSYRYSASSEAAYNEIRRGLGTLYNKEIGEILIKTPPVHIKALFDMHS